MTSTLNKKAIVKLFTAITSTTTLWVALLYLYLGVVALQHYEYLLFSFCIAMNSILVMFLYDDYEYIFGIKNDL
jgi:putative flippase GtrA